MNCKQAQNHFLFYIESSLSIEKTQEIDKHLKGCEKCAMLFDKVKTTYGIFDNAQLPKLDPYATNKIESYLKKHHLQIDVARLPFSRVFPKVAASIIVLIGICLGIFVGGQMKYLHTTDKDANINEVIEIYTDVYNANEVNQNMEAFFTNE